MPRVNCFPNNNQRVRVSIGRLVQLDRTNKESDGSQTDCFARVREVGAKRKKLTTKQDSPFCFKCPFGSSFFATRAIYISCHCLVSCSHLQTFLSVVFDLAKLGRVISDTARGQFKKVDVERRSRTLIS